MSNKVKYTKAQIATLPNNKPMLYTIQTKGGGENYIGTAKKGRGTERIMEHLGQIPGATVKIKQFPSIAEAREAEKKAIQNKQPKYNTQNK